MIYNDIKSAQIAARKAKDKVKALCLTTLMGELQTKSTGSGSKEISDELVVSTLKKFIKDIDFTIEKQKEANPDLARDKEILSKILDDNTPDQMSEDDIKIAMMGLIENGANNMGMLMKGMKEQYVGLYDGKTASMMAKNLLS